MRILVVEDEKILADSIKTGLRDEKFSVDVVYDGSAAYDMAGTEDYDVIVLDIMLPEMDGITLCKKLRAEKNYTPILMLTAKDTIDDKVTGLNIGADDYLVKPFSFEELLARIRSLIRRSQRTDPVLSIGNLVLNPATHIVKRKEQEISLTGKEYAVLEYFMNHPNQVLTREQILSHAWDFSYDSMSNVVDVFVKRLRVKIDSAFPEDRPLLTTVRGLGYRIGS